MKDTLIESTRVLQLCWFPMTLIWWPEVTLRRSTNKISFFVAVMSRKLKNYWQVERFPQDLLLISLVLTNDNRSPLTPSSRTKHLVRTHMYLLLIHRKDSRIFHHMPPLRYLLWYPLVDCFDWNFARKHFTMFTEQKSMSKFTYVSLYVIRSYKKIHWLRWKMSLC